MKERINNYIKKMGYTWTYESIIEQYIKYQKGEYISHTAKEVIIKCILCK